ncbi:AraC family transcriptional regulator [Chitinophaga sp. MM2321]|uniref:helix-turn-helix transcriptional regulator n=1 Tax=Chitinophaga sp. MM2321 TaxID=3137178 RepID=UPI0032D5A648
MNVVIRDDAQRILLQEDTPFAFEKISSRVIIEERQQETFDFGSYQIQEFSFDGIHMVVCNAEVYENIHVATDDVVPPRVMMMFMEQGEVSTTVQGVANDFRFSSREHNLMFSPHSEESAAVKKQRGIQLFGLSFTRERFLELADHNGQVLDNLANKIAGNKNAILADKMNPHITPRMKAVLAEIRQCGFQGGLKKLFLHSKAIELLALQCEQIENELLTGTPARNKISAAEIEKLHHARYILLEDLQHPPNLPELSRKAGLNEFKLKSGFKTLFDTTVFGYLSDHRLNLAYELVMAGEKPLAVIADEAGYSSPQHFSNAFRKKFGVSPGKAKR